MSEGSAMSVILTLNYPQVVGELTIITTEKVKFGCLSRCTLVTTIAEEGGMKNSPFCLGGMKNSLLLRGMKFDLFTGGGWFKTRPYFEVYENFRGFQKSKIFQK